MQNLSARIDTVKNYHERTKHHEYRFAASLGYMDWDTQPDPFRTYSQAPIIELPLVADELKTNFGDIFRAGKVPPAEPNLRNVACLFELALGISAWKQYEGSKWALRCNPSSGNLHPTEGYLVTPAIEGIGAGVYHYVSRDHVLERRCAFSDGSATLRGEKFLVGLTSIYWRESWKYGERAFRYCQHDVGHAIASVAYAAAGLGWRARLLTNATDSQLASLLGVDRDVDYESVDALDNEHPDCIMLVGPADDVFAGLPRDAIENIVGAAQAGIWAGKANVLSVGHHRWDVIDDVSVAAEQTSKGSHECAESAKLPEIEIPREIPAQALIRQRRSAQRMDPRTGIASEQFWRFLDCVIPRERLAPWSVLPWTSRLHLAMFVHRVDGLEPGLYVLERDAESGARLCAETTAFTEWTPVEGCPAHLKLSRLVARNTMRAAAGISCTQDIAGDGAFSLGMIADFEKSVEEAPWWYRRLFWESGVVGQALYLQAELEGISATGIGCYFDDLMHGLLGFKSRAFQSLYHFTVGGSIPDQRLTTLPPYGHLTRPTPSV
ncbi:MAG: SagB/ThcOx family dehydrogenase [Planctomycetes bacterium]|nr:SagB/ThcOx family dehydrogenase [Planctomycetota bacterium]